jgi:hypothetical protein
LADTHDVLRNDLSVEERLSKREILTDGEQERLQEEILEAELSGAADAPIFTPVRGPGWSQPS